MAAQSVSVYVYWEPSKSMFMDLSRDHNRDLDHFATAVSDALTQAHGDAIDYAPRFSMQPDPDRELGRFVHFWVPAALTREQWRAALVTAAKADVVLVPQERWVFMDGPDDYEEWHRAHP